MKVHIRVIDDNGAALQGEIELVPTSVPRTARKRSAKTAKAKLVSGIQPIKLDFTKQERAFVKQYAKGLSGSKKFVLVLAYLAKGAVGKEIPLADVEQHWNKMTTRLGTFNRKFTNDAKENGWVDTKKKGVYVLCASWREAVDE